MCSSLSAYSLSKPRFHTDSLAAHPHHWLDHWSVGIGLQLPTIAHFEGQENWESRYAQRRGRLGFTVALDWKMPLRQADMHLGLEGEHMSWVGQNPRISISQREKEFVHTARTYGALSVAPIGFLPQLYFRTGGHVGWSHSNDVELETLHVGGLLAIGWKQRVGHRERRIELWGRTTRSFTLRAEASDPFTFEVGSFGLRLFI